MLCKSASYNHWTMSLSIVLNHHVQRLQGLLMWINCVSAPGHPLLGHSGCFRFSLTTLQCSPRVPLGRVCCLLGLDRRRWHHSHWPGGRWGSSSCSQAPCSPQPQLMLLSFLMPVSPLHKQWHLGALLCPYILITSMVSWGCRGWGEGKMPPQHLCSSSYPWVSIFLFFIRVIGLSTD